MPKKRDKNMKRVRIGIDSGENLRYSMVVAGPENEINNSHKEVVNILQRYNVKKDALQ